MDNFAPSVGVVWSPNFGDGIMGTIFGQGGRSVFRAGYSRAFVREGSALQTTITGNTPGGAIVLSRNTGIAGSFTVGTNLRDPGNANITTPGFSTTPAFPLTLTAANQALAVNANLKTPTVDQYSFGYQREIDKNTVVEFRYVGNRGKGLYRLNFVNENNTIENGFANEFRLAQANLYANIAAGRGATFAFFGAGTSPLPIMVAYFNPTATNAPNIPQGSVGSGYTAANFGNAALVALLSVNNPNPNGFIGSGSFENNAGRRANAIANNLPSNFFRVNPAVPAGAFLLSGDGSTWYNSGVVEFRRRLSSGLRVQANYVFSKAQADYFASSGTQQSNYTLREGGLDLAKNVQPFDVRHQFKLDATYDLPFGTGRAFFGGSGAILNGFIGGWSILPTLRWQSGTPFSLGNVQLVGMTAKELQKSIGVFKNATTVTYLPDDIILNTQRAFDTNVLGVGGYGTTFGGAPSGRFIAPAGFGNCVSRFSGDCGYQNLILYGPSFFGFDVAVAKKVKIDEKRNFELRATFLDAFNAPSFRIGGWAADVVSLAPGGSTFGQLGTGSAYQDLSTTNNPGGRLIDLMLRINF